MPSIFWRKSFSYENMSEVCLTGSADNFRAAAVPVGHMLYGTRNLIVKGGPATAGAELIVRIIKWRIAAPADVGAGFFMVVVLTGKRHLRALADDDTLLFGT